VFQFSLADIAASVEAGAPLQGHCGAQELNIPSDFMVINGPLLVENEMTDDGVPNGFTLRPLSPNDDGQIIAGAASPLTLGNIYQKVQRVGTSPFFMLQYESGYVLVKSADFDIQEPEDQPD
jgi:hypothetical protein